MLRASLNRLNLSTRICDQITYNVSNNPMNVQSVRWRKRKPISLGTAPSKMFRVPPRRREEAEERAELMRLNKTYKTLMRSIKLHFKEEKIKLEVSQQKAEENVSELDFENITAINQKWNERVAKERLERMECAQAEQRKLAAESKAMLEEKLRAEIEAANEEIRAETEAFKTAIRPDTLDQAIEDALANPVDFNWAIDLKGQRYFGRVPKVKAAEKEEATGQ